MVFERDPYKLHYIFLPLGLGHSKDFNYPRTLHLTTYLFYINLSWTDSFEFQQVTTRIQSFVHIFFFYLPILVYLSRTIKFKHFTIVCHPRNTRGHAQVYLNIPTLRADINIINWSCHYSRTQDSDTLRTSGER